MDVTWSPKFANVLGKNFTLIWFHNLLMRELTDCIVAGFQENKFEGGIM
jgi:hypothetical protein